MTTIVITLFSSILFLPLEFQQVWIGKDYLVLLGITTWCLKSLFYYIGASTPLLHDVNVEPLNQTYSGRRAWGKATD